MYAIARGRTCSLNNLPVNSFYALTRGLHRGPYSGFYPKVVGSIPTGGIGIALVTDEATWPGLNDLLPAQIGCQTDGVYGMDLACGAPLKTCCAMMNEHLDLQSATRPHGLVV